jgi:transposase
LLAWLRSFGTVALVGIEGTGAYGAGLALHLHLAGVTMVEIDRPERKTRRWQGKSDPIDAEAAARAALPGVALEPRNYITARSKHCGCYASRAAARSTTARTPNARSRH